MSKKLLATSLLATFLAAGCTWDPAAQKAKYLASAEKYMQAHKYTEATIEYRNALRFEPNSATIEFKLGDAFTRAGNYREAFLAYRKASELDPTNVNAKLAVGRFYLIDRRFNDVIQLASEILEKDDSVSEASVLLADAYAGKKDIPQGIEILQKLLEKKPNDVNARLNLGTLFAAQGQADLARREFEAAVRIDPKSLEARGALTNFYVSQSELEPAEQQLRAALEVDPSSITAKHALANVYIREAKLEQAEALLKGLVSEQKNSAQSRFDLATFYMAQNKTADAAKIDNEIARDTPSFVPARLQLAEIALRANDLQQADSVILALLKDRPKEPQALIFHGKLLLQEKQPAKAISELEAAQKLEPNSALLHYLLGIAYAQNSNLERAQDSFERSIALDVRAKEPHLVLAQMMLDRDDVALGLRYAEEVLQADPNDVNALLLQGAAYGRMQDYRKARVAFEHYAKLAPASSIGPARLGLLDAAQKNYVGAEKKLEVALAMDPHNYDALNDLISVYLYEKKGALAIERIKQQIEKSPGPEVYNLLGKTYTSQNQFELAEVALKHALELDPQNFSSYVLLGNVYAQQKSLEKSLAQYKAATRINPKNASVWTVYGMLNEQLGHTAEAEQAYAKALEITPNSAAPANNLAWLFAQEGKEMDRALELARVARAAMPQAASVADTLGWIYYKRQLYGSAIPLLLEAVKQQPDHAEYHFHLAVSLLGAGKMSGARAELSKALDLDSNMRGRPEVQNAMGALKL